MDHCQIRSTLQAYTKGIVTTPQRQRDAVQKMLFLEPSQFEDLLRDVNDEINRRENNITTPVERSKTFSGKRNASRIKMSTLAEDKFMNLVVDVYLVLNHRYPDTESKNVHEIEELIDDLEKLINNLKGDMKYESLVIEQLKDEKDYKTRHHIFNKYVKRVFDKHKEDTCVIDYMETLSKETAHEKIDLTDMLETHVFMRHADHYFKYHNLFSDEYEYHKNNLFALKDEEIFEKETQNRIIRKTKARIFEIMLQTRDKNARSNVNIDNEISIIIISLENIKDVIKSNNVDACRDIGKNVLLSSASFIHKMKILKTDDSILARIEEERNALKLQINENKFEGIPENIFNLATQIKNILSTLPAGEIK